MKNKLLGLVVIGILVFSSGCIQAEIPETEEVDETEDVVELETHEITLENKKFVPDEITIKVGDIVTWTNMDSMSHKIVSKGEGGINSKLLSKEDTYSKTFDEPGTYEYRSNLFFTTDGVIIVE